MHHLSFLDKSRGDTIIVMCPKCLRLDSGQKKSTCTRDNHTSLPILLCRGQHLSILDRNETHLIVIRPTPVSKPMRINNVQKSRRGSNANPLISKCGDWSLSTSECASISTGREEDFDMREEASVLSFLSSGVSVDDIRACAEVLSCTMFAKSRFLVGLPISSDFLWLLLALSPDLVRCNRLDSEKDPLSAEGTASYGAGAMIRRKNHDTNTMENVPIARRSRKSEALSWAMIDERAEKKKALRPKPAKGNAVAVPL